MTVPNTTRPPPGQNGGAPPPSDPRPPAAIQTLIPPAVHVETPQHLYLDVPNLRCMSWSSQTPRGDIVQTQHRNTNICWRKVDPPSIRRDLQRLVPAMGIAPPKSSRTEALGQEPSGSSGSGLSRPSASQPHSQASSQPAPSRDTKEEREEPTELNFLRDRYFEVNINYGKTRKGAIPEPVNLVVDRYSNGHFKELTLLGGKETLLVRKPFHYEIHDSLGNYHAIVPMGILHQRLHEAVTNHLERIFGPTGRVLNRYYGSFQNGHQSRMMAKLWQNTQSGEGIKLVKRAWNTLAQSGDTKDNEGKGKGPPPPAP